MLEAFKKAGADGLVHVRTFEFLLPQAFTVAVYCRSDEDSKEVLAMAWRGREKSCSPERRPVGVSGSGRRILPAAHVPVIFGR